MSKLTMLLSCAGRRVELGEILMQSRYRAISADTHRTARTLHTSAKGLLISSTSVSHDAYVESVLSIVRNEAVDVVVRVAEMKA